jgi:hypothetical protein
VDRATPWPGNPENGNSIHTIMAAHMHTGGTTGFGSLEFENVPILPFTDVFDRGSNGHE